MTKQNTINQNFSQLKLRGNQLKLSLDITDQNGGHAAEQRKGFYRRARTKDNPCPRKTREGEGIISNDEFDWE